MTDTQTTSFRLHRVYQYLIVIELALTIVALTLSIAAALGAL